MRRRWPKPGRPSDGLSEALSAHITPEMKTWLADKVRETGLRQGDIVRRILDDARDRDWSPW
jgi:hypothetical protein